MAHVIEKIALFGWKKFFFWSVFAMIGRKSAVASVGKIRLKGFIGWLLWSFAHIWFLIGFRSRIIVAFEWFWSYLTAHRGARLISDRRR